MHQNRGMSAKVFDTLILSDVHLGSEVSRARDALTVLQNNRYRRVILLGDIFSDLDFRRLKREHWDFLSYIRKLSNPKRRVEVVWVEGNHDHGLSNIMSHLVGIPVYQRYVWEFDGKLHLAIHGHQFDRFVSANYLISRIGLAVYDQIQKIDSRTKTFSRFLDRLNTRWLRLSTKVATGALTYAKMGNIDRIFCGHTHVAMQTSLDGVHYFNTGSWTDILATYVTVCEKGVQIHEYSCGTDYRYPREERSSESIGVIDLFEQAGLPALGRYQSIRC
jgi:UDP-2,3-diacylglucosamine pyrophosphatase LpxH